MVDSRVSSTLARPAPPGRRRLPVSRSVSSTSASSIQGPRSLSPSALTGVATASTTSADASDEEVIASSSSAQEQDDLYHRITIETPSSEIPLEEVEEALSGLSREDLVMALKRAKEQMDILDSRLDISIGQNEELESRVAELTSQVRLSEADVESLHTVLQQREERVDELMREQDREDDEVFAKDSLIERLRKLLNESEKSRIEAERRYQDQTTTADKERQYFADMENLLKRQKQKASTAHERLLASNQELTRENQRLQYLVSQLRSSSRGYARSSAEPKEEEDETIRYNSRSDIDESGEIETSEGNTSLLDEHDTSLSSTGIRTLQDEAKALESEALQAEFLALQKSHDMIQAQMQQLQAELSLAKSSNAELRDQNETYMDILQEKTFSGALVEESAMFNARYIESETEESEADDVDDVPDEPRQQKRVASRGHPSKRSPELVNQPTSLANELESSDSPESIKEPKRRERRRERSEVLTDNIDELHKEIWSLRDANQALTLYVNKILDRIIAREGYENVLAIDGDDRSKLGTLRGTPSRTRSLRSRPSALETLSSPPTKASRRISGGGLLSFIGGSNTSETVDVDDPKTPTAVSPSSFAERARRTATLDWRSFIGGTSPTSPSEQFESPSIATRIGIPATSVTRKISSNEEVEDIHDVEEKEKIRQAMIRHGIQLPEHQLKSQKRTSSLGTFFTRVMGTAVSPSVYNAEAGKKDDLESVVGRGDQHPGPRLTTFDSLPPLAVEKTRSNTGSDSAPNSNPMSRSEARQRALDVGNSGSFTEVPQRISPISSRRSNQRRDTSSSTSPSIGDTSRGESVGGDESYQFNSPISNHDKQLDEEVVETDSTWGKLSKRMSYLGAKGDRPS